MKAKQRRLSSEEMNKTEYVFPEFGAKHINTIGRCRAFVGSLYREIERLHGERAARELFASFGGRQMPSDKSLDDDSALLWRYLSFEANQNAHELARILVNEGRSPTLEAALASIKRIKDPKSKRGKAAWDHLNWLISFSSSFFKREDLASRYK